VVVSNPGMAGFTEGTTLADGRKENTRRKGLTEAHVLLRKIGDYLATFDRVQLPAKRHCLSKTAR
jgi:hypothetical protein